jgi:hypothetical protein
MNRFLYAHANPATLIDPTGHAPEDGCAMGFCMPPPPSATPPDDKCALGLCGSPSGGATPAPTSYTTTIKTTPTQPDEPMPGPDPNRPSSPTRPTASPASDFDGLGAGIAGCSAFAPPPGQWFCDGAEIQRALARGDIVDALLSGIGLLPIVGDGLKWIGRGIRGGGDAWKGLESMSELRWLNKSPGTFDPRGLNAETARFGKEFHGHRGGGANFTGEPTDGAWPGKDAVLSYDDGYEIAVSFKQIRSQSRASIATQASDASKDLKKAMERGEIPTTPSVVAMEYRNMTMANVTEYAVDYQGKWLDSIWREGVVSEIWIKASGWMGNDASR